jgi:hypothetical protein
MSETREREAIDRQQQNDRRYLAWLRQLAEFLRHEVVIRLRRSIQVLRSFSWHVKTMQS